MRALITGATGFVGSHLARHLLDAGHRVSAVRRGITSLGWHRVREIYDQINWLSSDLATDCSGVCDGQDVVFHLAARTFVDTSIRAPEAFVRDNILATFNLLEDARRHRIRRFFMASTDEVLGQILKGQHDERAPLCPRNPYAASKAGAEAMAISYAHTYGLHTTITRCENIFGPMQHPQKVFPTFVRALIHKQKLPVYGDGQHVRQWLWVDDACRAFLHLLENNTLEPGEIIHIAGHQELTNLDLAKRIIIAFHGPPGRQDWKKHIKFIPDHDIRPGHDRRYALSTDKIHALGWTPKMTLDRGIKTAVQWYRDNHQWLD